MIDDPSNELQPPTAARLIEALLFTGGPPCTAGQIVEVRSELDDEQVVAAVAELNRTYHRQGRPYEIRRVGAGYQMILRPQFHSTLRRLHGRTREVRLSLAAVEVLSLVAYRQPITVQKIDSIRGVDSGAVVRQLRRRNLIQPATATDGDSSTPRYEITRRVLELFHLSSLDDLPRVQELEKA